MLRAIINLWYYQGTMSEKQTVSNQNPIAWLYPPIVVALLVGGAFWVGRLSSQVDLLQKGVAPTAPTAQQAGNGSAAPSPLQVSNLKMQARNLGMDGDKFDFCLDSGKYEQKVKDDLAYGGSLGVSGTPSFFINGVMLVGAQPQGEFEKIIDAEIKNGSGDKVGGNSSARVSVKTNVGYVRGDKNAKVKMVEFSDFECPFCKRAFPTTQALEKKYGSQLSVEYRHNPLPFHSYAQKSAEASECAGEQGKFWEMHDYMMGA